MEHNYSIHCPVEQYGFVAAEGFKTPEEAVDAYKEVMRVNQGGVGLPAKEFNEILDTYISTGKMEDGGDFFEQLSPAQRFVINEIKKSHKRRAD